MDNNKHNIIQHRGRFQPGVSGNPSGRPKADKTVRDLARLHTTDAINTLVEIAKDLKAAHSVRVHAATALLDRAWGKPAQYVESVNLGMSYEDFLESLAEPDSRL